MAAGNGGQWATDATKVVSTCLLTQAIVPSGVFDDEHTVILSSYLAESKTYLDDVDASEIDACVEEAFLKSTAAVRGKVKKQWKQHIQTSSGTCSNVLHRARGIGRIQHVNKCLRRH